MPCDLYLESKGICILDNTPCPNPTNSSCATRKLSYPPEDTPPKVTKPSEGEKINQKPTGCTIRQPTIRPEILASRKKIAELKWAKESEKKEN